MLAKLIDRIKATCDNPDPLAAIASVIALVVAANQPFYPLYLHAIAGATATPAWLTLLSTPAFAAVPFVARRSALAGRALLPLAGIANTVLGAKLMGAGAGVELFLLPCVLLAALLFRPSERVVAVGLLALAAIAYFVFDRALGAPLCDFSAEEATSIARLNGASVAGLLAFVGFQRSGVITVADAPSRGSFPNR